MARGKVDFFHIFLMDFRVGKNFGKPPELISFSHQRYLFLPFKAIFIASNVDLYTVDNPFFLLLECSYPISNSFHFIGK
jgi:hypothetical protein